MACRRCWLGLQLLIAGSIPAHAHDGDAELADHIWIVLPLFAGMLLWLLYAAHGIVRSYSKPSGQPSIDERLRRWVARLPRLRARPKPETQPPKASKHFKRAHTRRMAGR